VSTSRRDFLKAAGAVTVGTTGLGGVVSACDWGDDSTKKTPAAADRTPVRGGTVTIGMMSLGKGESVNPQYQLSNVDFLRAFLLFDRLFMQGEDIRTLEPRLATSAESNSDATLWTLHLREDVVWHDGKPFGADDVVWSVKSWSDPYNIGYGLANGVVDFKRVRARGPLTVEIPLHVSRAELPSALAVTGPVVQNGAKTKQLNSHPIGTGPFKFVSFTPGQQSVFAAHKDYWEDGKPYLDRVVVNSSFTDEEARQNALLGGQIDISSTVPPPNAKQMEKAGGVKLLTSHSPFGAFFQMRVDKGPFADVRVRKAMKLIADRQALVDGALVGYGRPANDLQGRMCRYFADDLPVPEQDIEQAKSLLKAAGQENLSFELPTSEAGSGYVASATLFAQQAKAAGVNVTVKKIDPTTYFTSAAGFLTRPIAQDGGWSYASLTAAYTDWFLPTSYLNETHWGEQPGGEAAIKLINEAMAAVDPARAEQLWAEVQKQQYDEGGSLVWANRDYVDAVADKVQGLKTTPVYNLNGCRLQDGWIATT
jgi:peptide/nickel transport system substrate-binding protein